MSFLFLKRWWSDAREWLRLGSNLTGLTNLSGVTDYPKRPLLLWFQAIVTIDSPKIRERT